MKTTLQTYTVAEICEGEEKEIKDRFRTINMSALRPRLRQQPIALTATLFPFP